MLRLVPVAMFFLLSGFAEASQLDVDHLVPSLGRVEIHADSACGQTFTMGQTGTLDSIVIRAANASPMAQDTKLEVYRFSNNTLTKLGESQRLVEVLVASIEYEFEFEGVSASAGEELAFLIFSDYALADVTDVDLSSSEPLLLRNGQLQVGGQYEVVFATYITPVPECSAALLMASGMGGLLVDRRRRWLSAP